MAEARGDGAGGDELMRTVRPRSMFDRDRWAVLAEAAGAAPPDGDVAEAGVGAGGVLAWLAATFPDRAAYGFCRFEAGLTRPTAEDGDTHLREGALGVPARDVAAWLASLRLGNVVLVPGDVRDTMRRPWPGRFALAVVDLNLYLPTLHAVNWFWELLVPGGTILVDDVGYQGVRRALEESGKPWRQDRHMAVLRRGP